MGGIARIVPSTPKRTRRPVEPGDRYGTREVVSEAGKDRHGNRLVCVRCDCGRERSMQASAFRMYKHCNLCAAKKRKPREQKQPESEKRCPCAACVAGGGVVPLVKLDLPEDPSPFDPGQDRVDEMWETSGRARR